MKKNISINIGGIIFHIEEDGYETLRKYLDSVNRYFASFDDSSEILADIEGRIAEIFLSKLNEGKQVITSEDVNTLIATMGSVSDFKAAEERDFAAGEPGAQAKKEKDYTRQASKKLYRDENRKVLGGVCAGLAHYFNVDPVWPRILFALLLLGYGFILLVYIIMWIFIPASQLEEEPTVKKMYRDPDKKVIGGVAAGIAAFFGTDLTMVRVIFVIAALFGGFGLVLYIIFWIALPEARTITEKMKMQGEPVTLSNIESSVKKSLNEKENTEESTLARIILFPFRVLAVLLSGIAKFLGPMLGMLVEVLRVAIGLVFTLSGIFWLMSLLFIFGIIVGIFNAPDWVIMSDWYFSSPNLPIAAFRNSFPTWTILFTFLAAVVPSIFIILLGSSIIARRITFNQTVGWSLFVVFFVSVIFVSVSLPSIILGFKEEGEYQKEESFEITGKTTVLAINETGLDDYDVTSLSLKGYEGQTIKVVERFQSQGSSRKMAAKNAQMVTYQVVQTDSVITFDSNITFKPDAQFRAQRLDVDIFVPFNQQIRIDYRLWRFLDTDIIEVNHRYFYSLNQETYTWVMTDKGLRCTDCPANTASTPKDQFGLKNFSSVEIQGIFTAQIIRSDTFALEITGPVEERNRYDVYVNGETLVIEHKEKKKFFRKKQTIMDDKIKVSISMPSIHDHDLAGAGKVKFTGFDDDNVDIKLTGAVEAEGDLVAKNLNVRLTGASYLELQGKGEFMDAEVVGASGLRAYGYEVNRCILEAVGASSARVNVTEMLEYKKGVASSVSHRGNPEIIRR